MTVFKNRFRLLLAILSLLVLSGCSQREVEWNGETIYNHVSMAIDETDMYVYTGSVDYIFAGKILKADDVIDGADGDSYYTVDVLENLKGELEGKIECYKHGGYLKDGTMVLFESDRTRETGLPEEGGEYILMAYAQPDGSLLLSEFYSDVEYSEENVERFKD